jgi:hypothetical protein
MTLALAEPADSGCVDVGLSTVTDGTSSITLYPRRTYNPGTPMWWWYYATISGCTGRTLTVDLSTTGLANGLFTGSRQGCWAYSADGPWLEWDSTTFPAGTIRFAKTTPFAQDTVHVCNYPAYPWAKVQADVAAWAASPYVSATASSAGSGDLSFTTIASRSNGYGRTCPAAKLYAFRIADTAYAGAKNRVVLSGGQHCGETPGQWCYGGSIDFLLGTDPRAAFLRRTCEFFCYPNVNPQGRYGGYFYSSPDAPDLNHGGVWDTTGQVLTVDACKAAIPADVGSATAAIDYHTNNWNPGGTVGDTAWVQGPTELQHDAWLTRIRNYTPGYVNYTYDNVGAYRVWAKTALDSGGSMRLSFAAETGSSAAYGVPEYRRHGCWLMYTLADCVERGVFPVQATDTAGRRYFI